MVVSGGRLWLWVVGDCGCEWWEIVVVRDCGCEWWEIVFVSGGRLWL